MTSIMLLYLLVVLSHYVSSLEDHSCGPLVKTAGYTYPHGDINLTIGADLNILCVLNEQAAEKYGPNASQYMRYVMGNKTYPSEIVNSTAIRFHIKDHPATEEADYFCMINGSLVCHNIVMVGTKPQDVTDFDCIGHNYDNFTCSFTEPENYVKTTYRLAYVPASRYSRSDCPTTELIKKTVNGNTTRSCTWSIETQPQYRHSHANFTLYLNASNVLGNRSWQFPIEHYTRVRPNKPEQLRGIATSTDSIKLQWNIPISLGTYPPGLEFRVSWWIKPYKNWTTIYPIHIPSDDDSQKKIEYELKNLPYAHCLYDIRVSIKSKPATEERMWSENASITVWTHPKVPDVPPKTTAGSFELSEGTANRLIYWQGIHNYQENGENFTYYLEVKEDPNILPLKVYNNRAVFANLPDKNYTFKIWSQNSVGKSNEVSEVYFPAQRYVLRQLSKLVRVDKGNGEYDIQWTESNDRRVTNYTLFWCSAQKERPHTCDGTINWETVPRGVKNKSLTLPTYNYEKNQTINIYQFAISANGYGTSSGLLWADCTIIAGTGVKLTQRYVKKVSSRYILLQWKLGCIKLGDIQGFNVSYCTIIKSTSQECQPNSQNFKMFDNNTFGIGEGELNITDLKPYTGYKIRLKPIVIGAESQFSEPMWNTTLEDTPTKPRNLKILNSSDRSIAIQWEKPLEENGHLRNFVILVNGVEKSQPEAQKEKQIYQEKILDLLPRTNYTIEIRACTTSCSSNSIHTSTQIGKPSKVKMPTFNQDNNSLIIKWEKPGEVGVLVDFYEVQIGIYGGDYFQSQYDINTTKLTRSYKCESENQTIHVRVRGINRNDMGSLLNGAWSEPAELPCTTNQSSLSWIILVIIISITAFSALMYYLGKKLWRKFLGMRHCPVKLPPGLDAVVNNFEPKEKLSDETLPGEPLLPDKFPSQARNPSGETSGCCSGTDSVSSSVESAGHMSLADSGTDHPRSPTLADSEHKDVSLRQRPNVKKTDYITMEEAPWATKPTQTGYSIIGLPPKKQESEYMPLADIASKSSYVPYPITQTPEVAKEPVSVPSSGYVPYLAQEPASKNTAYVVAGEPSSAKPAVKVTPVFTQKEDTSSRYVPPIEPKWSWPQQEPPSTGYVVVGDTQKADLGVPKGSNKGYIPHTKFDTSKSLKED